MKKKWLIWIFALVLLASVTDYYSRHSSFSGRHKVDHTKSHQEITEEILRASHTQPTPPAPQSEEVPPPPAANVIVKPENKILPPQKKSVTSKEDHRIPKVLFADVVTSLGVFTIRLWPDKAPKTVKNFIRHCEDGTIEADNKPLYTGLQIFRTIPDYFIQTGDPFNNGTGNPGSTDIEEFNISAIDITKGMVVMAKLGQQNSKSQFYIALRAMEKVVEGRNTVFGNVVSGLSLVQAISRSKADIYDKPLKPIIIKEIKIRRVY